MKTLRILLPIFFIGLFIETAWAQSSFQRGRRAVQKGRYSHTTKKYGRACEIFEKKRIKGEKKPIINLSFGRKRKPKLAEQN